MWLKISDALGIPRDVMNSFADVLPVYRYTVDAVFNFAKQQSWLEGVAATYATEGRMWKRYIRQRRSTKKMGYLNEGEALLRRLWHSMRMRCCFTHVHSDANDEHGDINEAILKQYCVSAPTCKKRRYAAARFRWENQETRHDIIYRYFVLVPRTKHNQCNLQLLSDICRTRSSLPLRSSARLLSSSLARSSSKRSTSPTRPSPAAGFRYGSPRMPGSSRRMGSTSTWS